MDLSPVDAPNEAAAPAPKPTHKFGFRSLGRKKLLYHSVKRGGALFPINAKGPIPQKLANRLKDRFRAEIVAECRDRHFEEYRRDTEALVNKELERAAKDHADKLESQWTSGVKAIRKARDDSVSERKINRKLEKVKDQRIRDLEIELLKHAAAAEKANREAQADSQHKAKQIHMLRKAEEAAIKDAAKEITDWQVENVSLKKQIDDVKVDLKASMAKVEDLEATLIQQRPLTEGNQQAKSILNLTNAVEQLASIVAEQAETPDNFNSTMVKELASQSSTSAFLEDEVAGLVEVCYAERQKEDDLETQIAERAAAGPVPTAEAPAEAVPATEASTEASKPITVQDDTTLSQSTTLVIPAVPSAPTKLSLRNIFENFILLAYYFLFGNLSLSFALLSLVIFPGTQLFLSALSNFFQADLSTEGETGPAATNTEIDGETARMPGDWGW